MVIRYHKRFAKRLNRLPDSIRAKAKKTIELFSQSPTHPRLRNHALKGNLQGRRAIAVTSNIRIVFEEGENKTIFILDIGTHNQVY